jgi:hypothetical protein
MIDDDLDRVLECADPEPSVLDLSGLDDNDDTDTDSDDGIDESYHNETTVPSNNSHQHR